jgi:plastocyanin
VALLTVVVLTALVVGGDNLALLAPFALVATVAAVLTWTFDRRWARVSGVAAAVISLGLFYMAFGVFQPFSPVEFLVGLAYLLGMILAFTGGIRAIRAGGRGQHTTSGGDRLLRRVVLSVIGVAAIASVVGFAFNRTTVDATEASGATLITMEKMEFDPSGSSVSAAGRLLLHNADPFTHDFTLDALGIQVVVGPGSEAVVNLGTAAPGTYSFVCSFHSSGGDGMVGTLTIAP